MIMNLCSSGDESENESGNIKREHQPPPKQKKKSVKQETHTNSNNKKKKNKPKKMEKITIIHHKEFATPIIKCSQTYINNLYKDDITNLTVKPDPNCKQLEKKKRSQHQR
eukprot:4950_1